MRRLEASFFDPGPLIYAALVAPVYGAKVE